MSILSRKRDLAYLVFFCIHIPVMFCVDLAPLYPSGFKPAFIDDVRKYYISTYQDKFFIQPPAWFTMYMWMELIYHVPLSFWAIGALLRDDARVPLNLLIYAMQTAITTSTCICDYLSWSSFSDSQKMELGKLYVPYLVFAVFMGLDMYNRLDIKLHQGQIPSQKKSN